MVVVFVAVFGAGVAFDPEGGAVGVVFFFPDGYGGFDGVDDGAAGCEGGVTVGGGDCDADGNFADLEMAGAVDAAGVNDVVVRRYLLDDALAFFFSEGGECLVLERGDIAPLMVVADPAFEGGETSGGGGADAVAEGAGFDGFVG